jgi:uncharacterized hydrophobic protein (TIGR00271 family)
VGNAVAPIVSRGSGRAPGRLDAHYSGMLGVGDSTREPFEVIHVRAVIPTDLTAELIDSLSARSGVLNLIVLPGVARKPDGDAVECDVIAAEANDVLEELQARGVAARGSVVVDDVGTELSARADAVEAGSPRARRHLPVWAQAHARIRSGGRYPPSWFVLLVIAGLIAAVGILTNSQILIVGAMVVGPEYAAILAVALALNEHDHRNVLAGTAALVLGFPSAVVATVMFSIVVRAAGLESEAFRVGIRPVSDLIYTPNVFSVVVATLAGVVGVVSVVEARSGALIGVFISVTTIPAAADIGVSVAYQSWSEATGSLIQLVLNVVILTAVGAVGLAVQHRFWRGVAHRSGRAGPRRSTAQRGVPRAADA